MTPSSLSKVLQRANSFPDPFATLTSNAYINSKIHDLLCYRERNNATLATCQQGTPIRNTIHFPLSRRPNAGRNWKNEPASHYNKIQGQVFSTQKWGERNSTEQPTANQRFLSRCLLSEPPIQPKQSRLESLSHRPNKTAEYGKTSD